MAHAGARSVSTEPTYGTHSCGRQLRRLALLKASAKQKDTTEDVSRPSVWVGSGSLSTFRLSKSVRRYQTRLRIPAPIRYLAIDQTSRHSTSLDMRTIASRRPRQL